MTRISQSVSKCHILFSSRFINKRWLMILSFTNVTFCKIYSPRAYFQIKLAFKDNEKLITNQKSNRLDKEFLSWFLRWQFCDVTASISRSNKRPRCPLLSNSSLQWNSGTSNISPLKQTWTDSDWELLNKLASNLFWNQWHEQFALLLGNTSFFAFCDRFRSRVNFSVL